MKRLFDKNDRYTNEAMVISGECYDALRPIFDKWSKYSIRDLGSIAVGAVSDVEYLILSGDKGEHHHTDQG